ncbi:MAG TPA: translation initiation factor IF-1 [Candidatus Hydrogenedentes bacterium]|jgi:translation initiation factor IF-1|nr:translation initiation factor IF-1 [Candidatus Hydrogenedentota bacterium]HPJ98526.1 translation initiation factor IF-1 [Candidatus Hydrogenedentota bacterium]
MAEEAEHTVDGTVAEALANGVFRVELADRQVVLAHISGKDSIRFVRVLPGDRVRVALSPYDHNRGRIVERYR